MSTTALPVGVAIPHPRRPLRRAVIESFIVYGRTARPGIPFGLPNGALTDVFFMVCCDNDRTQLQVLARLSRLILQPEFLDDLRRADTPKQTWQVLADAETSLSSEIFAHEHHQAHAPAPDISKQSL